MKLFILITAIALNGLYNPGEKVYYAKVRNSRTYMSSTNVTVTEYWFTKDKICILRNPVKTIYRKDLGIYCMINLKTSVIRTDSVKNLVTDVPRNKSTDIKYVGQSYEPEFEWQKPQYLKKDTVANYRCNLYKCEGDADFDRISLEYALTSFENKPMADLFNQKIISIYSLQNKRKPVLDHLKDHESMIPLKIVERVENAIAPFILTEIVVEKLEIADTTDMIFDIPEATK